MKKFMSVLLAVMMLVGALSAVTLTASAGEAEKKEADYKVLVWRIDGENAVKFWQKLIGAHFENMGDVEVVLKGAEALTADELEGVQLVYIINCKKGVETPEGQLITGAADILADYLAAGGRIVLNAEGNGPAEKKGTATLVALAAELGATMAVTDKNVNKTDIILNTDGIPALTADDSAITPNGYSPITATGENAVWVMKSESTDEVFVMDEKVGEGYITMLVDMEWLCKRPEADPNKDDKIATFTDYTADKLAAAQALLRDELLDSAKNIAAVADAKIPRYTVTLDSKNDTDAEALVIKEGEALPSVSVPVRKGYAFAGYFSQPDGKGEKYFNADGTPAVDAIGADVTLYALWKVESPDTGDSAMGLWIVLMAVSAMGLAAVAVESKKRITK